MITGNRGEWSEFYVLIKLLSEGKLYAADHNLNKITGIFYPILKIIRQNSKENLEYLINGSIKIIDRSKNKFSEIPIKDFIDNSKKLLSSIKKSSETTFHLTEIEDFMKQMKCLVLKSPSSEKKDITIVVHDIITGCTPTLGFSIKSKLGHPSTLLNASQATNFIFKLEGKKMDDIEIFELNAIKFKSKIQPKILYLKKNGYKFILKSLDNEIFNSNLQMVDTFLPYIISELLINYYLGLGPSIKDLTGILEKINPCNYNLEDGHSFYKYKIKLFLTNIALGMLPSKTWSGNFDATGGYIVVKEDGEVLCYHIYNLNEFQEYLFINTKLETPSTTRHDFGSLYTYDDDLLIKLNLQIRFK